MKLFLKKVFLFVATGAAAVLKEVFPAVRVSTVNSGTADKPQANAGIATSQAPASLLMGDLPAVATSPLGVIGTLAQTSVNDGIATNPVIRDFKVPTTPAAEIQQVTFALSHRSGATTATNTGTDTWTTPANGVGLHDGTNATSVGELLNARVRILELQFADFPNKAELTISLVRVHFYARQSGTVLNNGDLRFTYNIGAGAVNLATITGDEDDLGTPRTFDLTSIVAGSWTTLNALRTTIEHRTDVAEVLINGAADACELEIVASATMTL